MCLFDVKKLDANLSENIDLLFCLENLYKMHRHV